MAISKKIESLRIHYGFKREKELADYLGVKPSTLSSWKSRGMMDAGTILRKCKGIRPDWITPEDQGAMFEEEKPVTPPVIAEPGVAWLPIFDKLLSEFRKLPEDEQFRYVGDLIERVRHLRKGEGS